MNDLVKNLVNWISDVGNGPAAAIAGARTEEGRSKDDFLPIAAHDHVRQALSFLTSEMSHKGAWLSKTRLSNSPILLIGRGWRFTACRIEQVHDLAMSAHARDPNRGSAGITVFFARRYLTP